MSHDNFDECDNLVGGLSVIVHHELVSGNVNSFSIGILMYRSLTSSINILCLLLILSSISSLARVFELMVTYSLSISRQVGFVVIDRSMKQMLVLVAVLG